MLAGFVVLGQAGRHVPAQRASLAAPAAGHDGRRSRWCSCCSARSPSRRSTRSTPGCPARWSAPTPVSAYLHSATMVKAGVYLVARLAPAFADRRRRGGRSCSRVGLVTMVVGGLRALRQHDLKLLLAFGTVSQLGFLMVLFGAGTAGGDDRRLRAAARPRRCSRPPLFMVGRHPRPPARARATSASSRRSAAGWRRVRGRRRRRRRVDGRRPAAARLRRQGAGFEALHDARSRAGGRRSPSWSSGSVLTVAYAARFYWGAFVAPRSGAHRERADGLLADRAGAWPSSRRPRCSPRCALVLGVVPCARSTGSSARPPSRSTATVARRPPRAVARLQPALVLSAVALAGGAALFARPTDASSRCSRGARAVPTGSEVYARDRCAASTRVADRVTGVVQNGSLPVYAGVILLTAAVRPGRRCWSPARRGRAGRPRRQHRRTLPIVVVAARRRARAPPSSAAASRPRCSSAPPATRWPGCSCVQGAPDLALTQVAIETLSTVLFVLVLRRLPDRFERQSPPGAASSGSRSPALVGVDGLRVRARRRRRTDSPPPVSDEMVERVGARRPRPQRRQRDPRRLPRASTPSARSPCSPSPSIGAVALARVGRRAPASAASAAPPSEPRRDA